MILIVMGVTGTGKSTIGKMLSQKLNLPFHDADDFHPAANVEKMAAGIPLNDEDRRPWLERLAREMSDWEKNGGAVLACSALKAAYRELLNSGSDKVRFIHLHGSKEIIQQRMAARKNHFMPPSLLDSQFATLEAPSDAIVVDIIGSPDEIVDAITQSL